MISQYFCVPDSSYTWEFWGAPNERKRLKSPYSNGRILYRLIKIVEVILLIQAAWSLKRKTVIYIKVSFSRRTISHFYWEIVVAFFPQPFGFQCVLYHSTRSRNNIWQDSCQSWWAYVSIVIVMKWEYGISSSHLGFKTE